MKKFYIILICLLVSYVFAQTAKKKTNSAAAPAATPAFNSKDPAFIGFTGSFIKFGKGSGTERPFTISVSYSPWFFEATGNVNAGHNTADLDILTEDILAAIAYYKSPNKTSDGVSYEAGYFDLMIYLDDEPLKVSNITFKLTDKAVAAAGILAQAKTWNFTPGIVFRDKKYSKNVLDAIADPLDKSMLEAEETAKKKKAQELNAREQKRIQDSTAREQKRVRDSIAKVEAEKKKSTSSKKKKSAVEDDDDNEPPKKKKSSSSSATKKKKRAIEDDDDDDFEPPKKKKSSSSAAKKKKPAVEDDDDDQPKKKKKKKKRDDDDE